MGKKKSAVLEAGFFKPPIDAAYLTQPAHMQRREDRYEAGRSFRAKCPREWHADYIKPREERRDPIEILIDSGSGRIEALLPIRYGRMLASPFAFYRGGAAIMASDLSQTPSTGYAVQSCGDCHLMNFGAFATPERNIVFDINDFDETFPAPWEWDLKRLAASFVIASRHNGHRPSDCRAAAARVVECYRDKMKELAEMTAVEAWYSFLDYEALIDLTEDEQLKKRRKKVLKKAMERDHSQEFVKLAHVVDGVPRIKDNPPLVFHAENQKEPEYVAVIEHGRKMYRESLRPEIRVLFDRYEYADSAIKVVGVGSVGTYCAVGLFFAAENDPLFLQLKEARPSVLEPYVEVHPFASHGERVVFGQRLMQAASDIFLGHYINLEGKQCYVRQLRDVKVKPLVEIFNAANMLGFARNCGWALAKAHARSGDPAVIAGYIGKGSVFADAVAAFAEAYADQNEKDHALLINAIRDGRIDAYTE